MEFAVLFSAWILGGTFLFWLEKRRETKRHKEAMIKRLME